VRVTLLIGTVSLPLMRVMEAIKKKEHDRDTGALPLALRMTAVNGILRTSQQNA
jgi:hypothetical protein